MQIKVQSKVFKKALQQIAIFSEDKKVSPATKLALVIAKSPNNLEIRYNNLIQGVKTNCEAEVLEEGSVCLILDTLKSIIEKARTDELKLTTTEKGLRIKDGKSESNLGVFSVDDFANFSEEQEGDIVEIESKRLKYLIDKSIFAALDDDISNYVLCGALVEASGEKIEMACTDRKFLVAISDKIAPVSNPMKIIIPKNTLTRISRLLSDCSSKVNIKSEGNTAVFQVDNVVVLSRLIDGSFPDVKALLPKEDEYTVRVRVKKTDMSACINILATFSNLITASIKEEELVLESRQTESGHSIQYCNIVEKIKSADLSVIFDSVLLNGILNTADQEVILNFISPIRPIVVQDVNRLALCMPMKIS